MTTASKYKSPRDFEENPTVAVRPTNAELMLDYIAELETKVASGEPVPDQPLLEPTVTEPSPTPEPPKFAKTLEEAEQRYKNLQVKTSREVAEMKRRETAALERVTKFEGENVVLREQLGKVQGGEMILPRTPEELDEWKATYPDLWNMLKPVMNAEGSAANSDLARELTEAKASIEKFEGDYKSLAKELGLAKLSFRHPDWKEVMTLPAFKTWLASEPDEIQSMVKGYDGEKAARVVQMFKSSGHYKPTKVEPKSKVDNADAAMAMNSSAPIIDANGTTKRIWKASDIRKMSSAEYDSNYDEINSAAREGRIDERA